MTNVVYTCPAYDVVEKKTDSLTDLPILFAGDSVYLMDGKRRRFKMGSVVSFSLKSNMDPIKAYQDAVERGHELHFLTELPTTITTDHKERESYYALYEDELITFEGRVLRVKKNRFGDMKLVDEGDRKDYFIKN